MLNNLLQFLFKTLFTFRQHLIKGIYYCLTIYLVIFTPFTAQAFQDPIPVGTDGRFQTFVYNPNEVYRLTAYYNQASYIEFAAGETPNTIIVGDPTAWEISPSGNRLFIKPIADFPETNMTVFTNLHEYNFLLDGKETKNIFTDTTALKTKFIYPDDSDKNLVVFASTVSEIPEISELNLRDFNFNYEFTGERGIAPLKIFDDGEFTYMEFSQKNAEVPAVFMVDNQGYESLVNFRVVGNYVVIERVAKQFTLRNGADIVCIYNNGFIR